MNRREALSIIGAITFSACARTTPSPQETKDVRLPAAQEKSAPLEGQAKQVVFDAWTSLLSQERSDGTTFVGLTTLKTQINNPDWQKNFSQILSSNTHPTNEPLKTRWLATWFKKDPQYGVGGEKYYGEIEFNNIKLKAIGARPTSAADIANGIEWAGGVTIDFITRRRAVFATTPFGWTPLSKEEALKRWLTEMNEGFPQFSPWQPDQWGSLLLRQNGRWQRQSTAKDYKGMLGKFEVPSESMYNIDCGNPGSSCKKVIAEIR